MSDLLSEQRITFGQLARREGVHISTVWRWALRGCKGHRLQSFSIGGKKFTTDAAYERWIAAINDADGVPPVRTSRQRAADQSRAKSILAAAGIG